MKEKSTKKNLKSQTDLARLHRKSDSDIVYKDNPKTTKEFWKDAKIYMPTHKVHLSVRLDENVVNFFKQEGPGYQSRINAVLRAYVHSHSQR